MPGRLGWLVVRAAASLARRDLWDVAVTCDRWELFTLDSCPREVFRLPGGIPALPKDCTPHFLDDAAKFLGFLEAFPLPKVQRLYTNSQLLYTPHLCELQTVCCRGPMKAIKSSSRSRRRPTCPPIVHCCLEVVILVESASGPTIDLDC